MRNRRLQVWPYITLALFIGAIGGAFLHYNIDTDIPSRDALQKISGSVDKLFLMDDLSGKQTGLLKPMNSIHFTLEDVEGEFRYPSSWPGYSTIWRQLSFHVDVWVRKSDIGSDMPMIVYRFEQQVPEDWVVEPFSMSYERITETQDASRRSYVRAGTILLAAAAGLVLIAMLVHIRNRWKPTTAAR